MAWGWVIPLMMAYSARESAKAAGEANKPQSSTVTRNPYYGDTISKLLPYLVAQQQKVYESRQKAYGFNQTDAGYGNISELINRLLNGVNANSIMAGRNVQDGGGANLQDGVGSILANLGMKDRVGTTSGSYIPGGVRGRESRRIGWRR